jgi:hypothetical protein
MKEEQAIQLLWEEWKYRHDLYWRTLLLWGGSVITLWIVPFAKPEVFRPWPKVTLLFPILAFLLAIFSAWLLGAEQRRFEMINQIYSEVRKPFSPPSVPRETITDRLFAIPIGSKIVWVYGAGLSLISLIVLALIYRSLGAPPCGPEY